MHCAQQLRQAAAPSLLRLPTIAIITTAQVVNGVLLPAVASMLLLSLNHAGVMGRSGPQPMAPKSEHENFIKNNFKMKL